MSSLLVVGCVSLTKPENVRKYCPTSSAETCRDDYQPPPEDASPDRVGTPDAGRDLNGGPDVAADLPVQEDGPSEGDAEGDATTVNPDLREAGAEGRPEVNEPVDSGAPDVPVVVDAREPGQEVGPDAPPDVGRDLPAPDLAPDRPEAGRSCTIHSGPGSGEGHPPAAGKKGEFCIATCDDIQGWGCSNFTGRTVSVNGGTATSSCGAPAAPTKQDGYIVFQVSAGSSESATIYWWGVYNANCPAPANGF